MAGRRQDEFGAKALRLALGTSDDVVGGKLAVSSEELAARAKSIEYKPLVDKSKTVVRHFASSKKKAMWVPKSARDGVEAAEAVKAAQAAAARVSGSAVRGGGGLGGQGGGRVLRRGAGAAGTTGVPASGRILKRGERGKATVKREGGGARILKQGGGGSGGGGASGGKTSESTWGSGLKEVKPIVEGRVQQQQEEAVVIKSEGRDMGGNENENEDDDSDLDIDVEDDDSDSESDEDEDEIAARRARLRSRLLKEEQAPRDASKVIAALDAATASASAVAGAGSGGAGLSGDSGGVSVVENVARVLSKGAGARAKNAEDDEDEDEDGDEDGDGSTSGSGDSDSDSDSDSDEDSEDDSSEEEDAPKIRFVPRSQRATVLVRERKAEEAEKRIKIATEKRLKRQGRARQDVLNLVDAERAAAAKAAKEAEARSSGNVIAGSKEAEGMPDDTDLDEEAEEDFKAWSERELKRLQRSARERLRAERDEAEKKRRRQMTEEEKTAEDEALIKAGLKVDAHTKEKTNMKFMQTYRHKGAFFQDKDELAADDVRLRNVNAVATESEGSRDMAALPKVMQVKRFGRKGNTKYTHLADQDTSRAGNSLRDKFKQGNARASGDAARDAFFSMAPRSSRGQKRGAGDGTGEDIVVRDAKRAKFA